MELRITAVIPNVPDDAIEQGRLLNLLDKEIDALRKAVAGSGGIVDARWVRPTGPRQKKEAGA